MHQYPQNAIHGFDIWESKIFYTNGQLAIHKTLEVDALKSKYAVTKLFDKTGIFKGSMRTLWVREESTDNVIRCQAMDENKHIALKSIDKNALNLRIDSFFYPNGKRIASGSFDGVVKCWDVQSGACLETFHAKGPYAGMNISGVTGISDAQKTALKALGALEE